MIMKDEKWSSMVAIEHYFFHVCEYKSNNPDGAAMSNNKPTYSRFGQ